MLREALRRALTSAGIMGLFRLLVKFGSDMLPEIRAFSLQIAQI